MENNDMRERIEAAVFSENGTFIDYDLAIANLVALLEETGRKAERRGEISQLKVLMHWAQLHNIDIGESDLQHFLDSLEQVPSQPLARENLAALQSPSKVSRRNIGCFFAEALHEAEVRARIDENERYKTWVDNSLQEDDDPLTYYIAYETVIQRLNELATLTAEKEAKQ